MVGALRRKWQANAFTSKYLGLLKSPSALLKRARRDGSHGRHQVRYPHLVAPSCLCFRRRQTGASHRAGGPEGHRARWERYRCLSRSAARPEACPQLGSSTLGKASSAPTGPLAGGSLLPISTGAAPSLCSGVLRWGTSGAPPAKRRMSRGRNTPSRGRPLRRRPERRQEVKPSQTQGWPASMDLAGLMPAFQYKLLLRAGIWPDMLASHFTP